MFDLSINFVVYERIETIRKVRGLETLEGFLRRAGVSKSAWDAYGKGQQDLPFRKVLNLCEAARINLSGLIAEIQLCNQSLPLEKETQ